MREMEMGEHSLESIDSAEPFTGTLVLLDIFYGMLFHPLYTLNVIGERNHDKSTYYLGMAALWVILVSALSPIVRLAIFSDETLFSLVWQMPLAIVAGLFSWGFIGLLIALMAYCFMGNLQLKKLLTLTGYAPIPWVLMGTLIVIKNSFGDFGQLLFSFWLLIIWLWTTLLFVLAIRQTYTMNLLRVFILLAMPFGMGLVFVGWLAGFIGNIQQLLSN